MGLTNFPNGISSMGIQLSGANIPSTFGTYYFVDADNGSDGNNGLSMDQALLTVLAAYNLTTSGAHDVIVLTGNAPHAIAAEIITSKSRVHFWGLGLGSRYIGQRTRFEMAATTTGTGIAIIQNTGNGNTFTNIKFRSTDDLSTSIFAFADGGEHTQLTNCSFEKAEDLDQAGAAEFLANGDTCYYKNCTFGNTIYVVSAARQNILLTREQISGKVVRDCIWEDCIFLVQTTNTDFANIRSAANNDIERLILFKNCTFLNAKNSTAEPTDAFDITSDLANAEILLQNCALHNITDWAVASRGVFSSMAVASATGGRSTEVP